MSEQNIGFTVEEAKSKIGQVVYLKSSWFSKPACWRGKVIEWRGAANPFGGASKIWLYIEWDQPIPKLKPRSHIPAMCYDSFDKQEYYQRVSEQPIDSERQQ